jgi:hypothetical protein
MNSFKTTKNSPGICLLYKIKFNSRIIIHWSLNAAFFVWEKTGQFICILYWQNRPTGQSKLHSMASVNKAQ